VPVSRYTLGYAQPRVTPGMVYTPIPVPRISKNWSLATFLLSPLQDNLFYFFFSTNLNIVKVKTLYELLLTQSKNSSAKHVLCVEGSLLDYGIVNKENIYEWNRLEDIYLFTFNEVFMMISGTFYDEMIRKVINRLIPTGVMNHLIENFYERNWKFVKAQNIPKILNLNDLLFSFIIWSGLCLVSFIVLMIERQIVPENILFTKKLKFAKISPANEKNNENFGKLNEILISKFRTFKNEQINDSELNFCFDSFFD